MVRAIISDKNNAKGSRITNYVSIDSNLECIIEFIDIHQCNCSFKFIEHLHISQSHILTPLDAQKRVPSFLTLVFQNAICYAFKIALKAKATGVIRFLATFARLRKAGVILITSSQISTQKQRYLDFVRYKSAYISTT